MRRKRRRNAYVGCSLASHRGKLRLEWRVAAPDGSRRTRTWPTGDVDSPANRERWDPVRRLVATLRDAGEDPRVHLRETPPVPVAAATAPATPAGPTVRSFYREWIESKAGAVP